MQSQQDIAPENKIKLAYSLCLPHTQTIPLHCRELALFFTKDNSQFFPPLSPTKDHKASTHPTFQPTFPSLKSAKPTVNPPTQAPLNLTRTDIFQAPHSTTLNGKPHPPAPNPLPPRPQRPRSNHRHHERRRHSLHHRRSDRLSNQHGRGNGLGLRHFLHHHHHHRHHHRRIHNDSPNHNHNHTHTHSTPHAHPSHHNPDAHRHNQQQHLPPPPPHPFLHHACTCACLGETYRPLSGAVDCVWRLHTLFISADVGFGEKVLSDV